MKIYISLPITGCDIERCKERAERAKMNIYKKGHTPVSPFDVCPKQKKPYAMYMGKDIQALLGSDAIFLLTGWSESRGCQLEWRCAQIYNKNIYKHLSEIPDEHKNDDGRVDT